jgi:hypothetical protein
MSHTCHAYGCNANVRPEMFMCFAHWRRVPKDMQKRIWATYRPGQCDDKHITPAYGRAAQDSIRAVASKERKIIPERDPCLLIYDIYVREDL